MTTYDRDLMRASIKGVLERTTGKPVSLDAFLDAIDDALQQPVKPPEPPRPTVGRIVHYYSADTDGIPLAAIITNVSSSQAGLVGLVAFKGDETIYDAAAVFNDEVAVGRSWSWPPRV